MSKEISVTEEIAHRIFVLRGQKVMLSVDLALLYGVSVRALTQAVKVTQIGSRKTSFISLRVRNLRT